MVISDVLVCLQYRDRLSLGENRIRLGLAAFHWSIIICRPQEFHRFDVTDGIVLGPAGEDINPSRAWIYRHQITPTLIEIPRYLGAVRIGGLTPSSSTPDDMDTFLQAVPLPKKDAREENCVSWTRHALRAMLAAVCVSTAKDFDLAQFMEYALRHADERIKYPLSTPHIVDYPPQQKWKNVFKWLLRYV